MGFATRGVVISLRLSIIGAVCHRSFRTQSCHLFQRQESAGSKRAQVHGCTVRYLCPAPAYTSGSFRMDAIRALQSLASSTLSPSRPQEQCLAPGKGTRILQPHEFNSFGFRVRGVFHPAIHYNGNHRHCKKMTPHLTSLTP